MLLMPAPLMATTALIGLSAACSSVRARGSTVLDGWDAGAGLTDGTVVHGSVIRAGDMLGVARRGVDADGAAVDMSLADRLADTTAGTMGQQ
jgi:hypothetical protein